MNTIYALLALVLFFFAAILMIVDSLKTRAQLLKNRQTDEAILKELRRQRIEAAFRGAVEAPKEEWRQLMPELFRGEK